MDKRSLILRCCLVDHFADPLAADNRASIYGIYGRQCGTETGFSPVIINLPMLQSHLHLTTPPVHKDKREKTGNVKKNYVLFLISERIHRK
jgi:hypothetical protein